MNDQEIVEPKTAEKEPKKKEELVYTLDISSVAAEKLKSRKRYLTIFEKDSKETKVI